MENKIKISNAHKMFTVAFDESTVSKINHTSSSQKVVMTMTRMRWSSSTTNEIVEAL